MPYENLRGTVDWSDDRYPPPPDERFTGIIRLHREDDEPFSEEWPEEFECGGDLVGVETQARYEHEMEQIRKLEAELSALREEGRRGY